MRNNKCIIAVVGPSRHVEELANGSDIAEMAGKIGKLITSAQHVLLTGGVPDPKHSWRVKSAAMIGAKNAGDEKKPCRLISVLTKKRQPDVNYFPEPGCRHLIIETTFTDERNFLNGYVTDVVIAISGGYGTLSEIAFAHLFGTPVVFIKTKVIDTIKRLKDIFKNDAEKKEFYDIMEKTHKTFPVFDPKILIEQTIDLLDQPDNIITTSAEESVNRAIAIAINRSNSLPDNMTTITGKYENALLQLVSSNGSSKENKNVVLMFFNEVCNQPGKEHLIKEIFAEHFNFNGKDSCYQNVENYLEEVRRLYKKPSVLVDMQVTEGDMVSTKRTWKGIEKSTGIMKSWFEISIVRMKNGKIVDDWMLKSELRELK